LAAPAFADMTVLAETLATPCRTVSLQARAYAGADETRWEQLCRASHCASFLHQRAFLSYHGNRFVDRSLVLHEGDRWLGMLPAAEHPTLAGTVESHPGITYGGWVHDGALRGERAIEAMRLAAAHYAQLGYRRLRYKPLPHIYHRAPAQDDLYALFRLGAQRVRCDLSACIDLGHALPASERRRRGAAKARKAGLDYACGAQHAPALWDVLTDNLRRKHASQPVHDLAQIQLLATRFAEHIAFHVARQGGDVVAGTVSFRIGAVVHLQYIAASEVGHAVSALDGLMQVLIAQARDAGARYFDFGTSNEDQGRALNDGLYRFKCEFGAGGVAYETYELDLTAAV
jgi:hypothetical protein